MTDLSKFAAEMMKRAKHLSRLCDKEKRDFVPIFFIFRNGEVDTVFLPNYAANREQYIARMKQVLKIGGDAYALVMEAWFTVQPRPEKQKAIDMNSLPLPSNDPNRRECLLVQCGSRDGREVVFCVEIKRRGDKLTFEKQPVEVMTARTSNLFGTEAIN